VTRGSRLVNGRAARPHRKSRFHLVRLTELNLPGLAAAIALAVAINPPQASFAHGGGLDAQGCHNDRKRGGYHCHGRPSGPSTSLRASSAQGSASISRTISGAAYLNCAAVRAARAAPIRRGQDGYSRRLDRDGDGVACE
jgi:hypothetical protein